MWSQSQVRGQLLLERSALRGHQDDLTVLITELLNCRHQRLGPQNHARTTSVGRGIDAPMLVLRPVTELMGANLRHPGLAGASDNGLAERRHGHFGKEGYDVDAHEPIKLKQRKLEAQTHRLN